MKRKRIRIEIKAADSTAFMDQLKEMGMPFLCKLPQQPRYAGSKIAVKFFNNFRNLSSNDPVTIKIDMIIPKKEYILLKLMNTTAVIKRAPPRKI